MAHVLVDFIHHKAHSIADEIARAEAAMHVLPQVMVGDGGAGDPAGSMLGQLRDQVERLKELSSLRTPLKGACCPQGGLGGVRAT
jgi:hypothetical protein